MDRDSEFKDAIRGLDRARSTLQLRMVSQGYDFETHGGKAVRYKGPPRKGVEDSYPPKGWAGEVVYTKENMFGMPECVNVQWERWRDDRPVILFHEWWELEVAE